MLAVKFVFILISCILMGKINAWEAIASFDPKTGHLGDCYTKNFNIGSMKIGEEKRIQGVCAVANCGSGRNIYIRGCGTYQVGPPCKVVDGDLSEPYPKCCYKVECPKQKLVNEDRLIWKDELNEAEIDNGLPKQNKMNEEESFNMNNKL